MSNSFAQTFGRNRQQNNMQQFVSNPNNTLQNAMNFVQKNNITNPEAVGKSLLSSGQMSQEQFQFLSTMANMILGKKG